MHVLAATASSGRALSTEPANFIVGDAYLQRRYFVRSHRGVACRRGHIVAMAPQSAPSFRHRAWPFVDQLSPTVDRVLPLVDRLWPEIYFRAHFGFRRSRYERVSVVRRCIGVEWASNERRMGVEYGPFGRYARRRPAFALLPPSEFRLSQPLNWLIHHTHPRGAAMRLFPRIFFEICRNRL